jgi:hypothetical protein
MSSSQEERKSLMEMDRFNNKSYQLQQIYYAPLQANHPCTRHLSQPTTLLGFPVGCRQPTCPPSFDRIKAVKGPSAVPEAVASFSGAVGSGCSGPGPVWVSASSRLSSGQWKKAADTTMVTATTTVTITFSKENISILRA